MTDRHETIPFPQGLDDAGFERERALLSVLREPRVPARLLDGFGTEVMAAIAAIERDRPEATRRRMGIGLWRAAAAFGVGLLLSVAGARIGPRPDAPTAVARQVPREAPPAASAIAAEGTPETAAPEAAGLIAPEAAGLIAPGGRGPS
ncbi:MAG: hypothetical protein U0166_04615 [Acidobacteriota bacterium]